MICLVALILCAGCKASSKIKKWEEPPVVPLVVFPSGPTDNFSVAPVTVVQPPDIGFGALISPDPNHIRVILAPATGTVLQIQPSGHLEAASIVSVISGHNGQTPIPLPGEGTWRPRRRPGQTVLLGDSIGLLVEHGFWLAVGQVSDIDYGAIHGGDIALVSIRQRGSPFPGHVEFIRPPGGRNPYYAEIAVEFRAAEDFFSPGTNFAHVEVTPLEGSDSMLAVPRASIMRLSVGNAVFVPAGNGSFEVRWVWTGSDVGDRTVVRRGLERGMRVISGGLEALALAARDSLARRDSTERRKGK